MFSSFFKRSTPSVSAVPTQHEPCEGETVRICIEKGGGTFFSDFRLFHRDTSITIDLLLFFPNRGLYIGQTIPWNAEDLEGASVERASRRSKKTPATQLESTEHRIRQKLQDVLSFDSTPCERFFWMKNLSEEEFDLLDGSFHDLLPKERLIFCGENAESILAKIRALTEERDEPFCDVKVLGSLQAHTLLLPTPDHPFGSFLSDEQLRFLNTHLSNTLALAGNYGSGKSTVLVRKILDWLLNNTSGSVLILTPTRLGGELLRLELVSLMEHSAVEIDLTRTVFVAFPQLDQPHALKALREASLIICDNIEQSRKGVIETIISHSEEKPLVFATAMAPDIPCDVFLLENSYRIPAQSHRLFCQNSQIVANLMAELRKRLELSNPEEIMIVCKDHLHLSLREALNEYLGLGCTLIDADFSLQYGHINQLLIATPDAAYALSMPHLFVIIDENSTENEFLLSRGSETATIITVSQSNNPSLQET